jgi:transposase-like protein
MEGATGEEVVYLALGISEEGIKEFHTLFRGEPRDLEGVLSDFKVGG